MMISAIAEKAGFGLAAVALFLNDRWGMQMLGAAVIDLLLGALLAVALVRTRPSPEPAGSA